MDEDRAGPGRADRPDAEGRPESVAWSPPPLTHDAVRLYRVAVSHPEWNTRDLQTSLNFDRCRFGRALRVLRSHRLLRPSLDGHRSWCPVPPESAAIDMLTAEENRLRQEQALLSRVRDKILALQQTYVEALQERAPVAALDLIRGGDRETVPGLLDRYADQARGEVRVMALGHDLDRFPWLTRWGAPTPLPRSGRGFRLLVDASMLCHQTGRRQLEAWCGNGNDVRTAHLVPLSLIVFGAALAVLPTTGDQSGADLVVIRHTSVVQPFGTAFDRLWGSARPFQPEATDHDANLRGEMRLEIMQLLAAGHKDEVIARKVGLSVRTCRRHIAQIMEQLGASSRFQAGALAERHALGERAGVVAAPDPTEVARGSGPSRP